VRNDQLEKLRTDIDAIDHELLRLIKKRLNLTGEIGRIKKEKKMAIIDSSREEALFNALARYCEEMKLDKVFIKNVWRLILNASYLTQDK
jgi:chorismate mutase